MASPPKKALSGALEGYSSAIGKAQADQGPPYTKAEANYRDADPASGDSCGTCANFDGHSTCKVVSGRISADHVSDEFKAGKKGSSGTSSSDSSGGGSASASDAGPVPPDKTGA